MRNSIMLPARKAARRNCEKFHNKCYRTILSNTINLSDFGRSRCPILIPSNSMELKAKTEKQDWNFFQSCGGILVIVLCDNQREFSCLDAMAITSARRLRNARPDTRSSTEDTNAFRILVIDASGARESKLSINSEILVDDFRANNRSY